MKFILLDRDGVINHESSGYIKSPEEFELYPDSVRAIANLSQAGYTIIICTNQSGLGRGLFNIEQLNEIHTKLHKAVNQAGGHIDAIFYCPHLSKDNCSCRKPKPGMILDVFDRFNIENPSNIMFVGDSARDLDAIHAVGGIPVLVKTGNGLKTLSNGQIHSGTLVFNNLLEVSEYLID